MKCSPYFQIIIKMRAFIKHKTICMYLFSLSKQIPYIQGSPLQSDPNANIIIAVDNNIRVKIFLHVVLTDDG